MDLISALIYVIFGGIFILFLLAYASPSQAQRMRFIIGVFLVLVVYLIIIIISIITNSSKSLHEMPNNFLFFCVFWPQVIGRLIARLWVKPSIAYSKINRKSVIEGMKYIVITLCFSLFIMIPNRLSVIGGKPVFDQEYFSSRLVFLLAGTIPLIIISLIIALQRTIFSVNGILHYGMAYSWSDFQTGAWIDNPRNSTISELSLVPNSFFAPTSINITVSSTNRQAIEEQLATVGLRKSVSPPPEV